MLATKLSLKSSLVRASRFNFQKFAFTNMAPSRIGTPPPALESPHKFAQAMSGKTFGDFRDDFFRDGFAIIKGAVPQERAAEYKSAALDWLESFNIGFDRNDRSTWKKENVPQNFKGGMFLQFSAAHEKYMWDARWYIHSHAVTMRC